MMDAFSTIFSMKYFWGLLVIGFFYTITQNKIVPVWFVIMLFFYQLYEQFFVISGSIMVGALIGVVYEAMQRRANDNPNSHKPLIFLGLVVSYLFMIGYQAIIPNNDPVINKYSFKLAAYVKEETPADTQYLMVASPNEAEWFPYLLSRTPVIGNWGGEWLGNYHKNLEWVLGISDCNENQSYKCISDWISKFEDKPNIIITKSAKNVLTARMLVANDLELLYENKEYLVWHYLAE